MPLGRFTVKNEYGLGVKELYKDGVESEDPKAVLDGVAVAGLVGLLRQLGDLSLFAAEIFHGLQEDVASTASRSRKLVTRVEQIEASLPSLEKAILSQTSHMHFAYSPGSEWHPRIKNEQNHFICDDLPHFIMDSYEECNEPPRLQLLDRFDTGGPGSCLKRYSDPTFFRRASASFEARNREKTQRERKIRKSKGSSWRHSGRFSNFIPSVTNSERVQISPPKGSSHDRTVRTDLGEQSDSFTSKISAQADNTTTYELSDTRQTHHPSEQISDVTWDEKLEIMERMDMSYETETNGMLHQQDMKPVSTVSISHADSLSENDQIEEVSPKDDVRGLNESNFDLYESFHQMTPVVAKNMNHVDNLSENESTTTSEGDYLHENHVKTVDAENSQVDNKSEVTSCSESDLDGHSLGTTINGKFIEPTEPSYLQETHVMPMNVESHDLGEDLPTTIIDWDMELIHKDLNESNFDHHETFTQVKRFSEGEHSREENDLSLDTIPDSFPQVARVPLDGKLSIDDVQYMLEAIEKDKWAIEKVKAEDVGTTFTPVADLSEVRSPLELIASEKFVSGLSEINIDKAVMEARNFSVEYDDPVNNVNLLEWPCHDDIDSETDNFVDALNTIDSESESEYDSQPRVEPLVSEFKLLENAPTSQRNGVYDVCEQPDVPLFLTNFENLENVAASHLSEAAVSEEQDSLPCFSNEESFECPPSLPTVSQGLDVCVNAAAETTFQPAATEMTLQPATAEMTMQPAATGMTMQPAAAGMTLQPAAAEMTIFQPATTEMIVQPAAAEMRLQPAAAEMTLQPAAEMTFQPAATEMTFQPAATEMTLQPAPTEMTTLLPAVCKTVESSSKYSHDDKAATVPPHLSEDFPCASSTSSDPVAFWTNATLFGLQPSKPTVTSTSNSNPMNAGNGNGYIDADPGRTTASSIKNYIDDDNSDSNSQEARDVGSLNPMSHDVLDNNASIAQDLSKVSSNAGEDRSSLLSLLGRNLLRNGLRRSGSLDNDVKNTPNNPLPASVNEKSQVSVNSPPPSPPLKLMKISFRPMDGFETSKLKLKYPEGIDNHENNMETFPSFQLVPESSRLHHDMGSDDSDDDTFCQSYPCVSDDSVGHLSGSDSEQWDSGHSSTESPSSSPLHEETQPPILGSKIGYAEMKACLNNPGLDITPQLPPLPPLEWRASRTLMNGVEEDKRERGSDSLNSKSFHSHLSNESALVQGRVRESDTTVKKEKMGAEPKAAHDQKQNLHAADEKNVDDQGDFLRQIRSKSFNLKRTDAARAIYTPILPTSTKVTAILQKASAIRQAVGSDGEDDSWSDT